MIRWLKNLVAAKELRTLESVQSDVQEVVDTLKRPAPRRIPCKTCYGGDLPCVCRYWKNADLWDVAHTADSEPGRVEYRFLGVTGEEEG